MKILHVVTLHSADNAFGGPVRVALNLASELLTQGNSVVLLAGSHGLPPTVDVEGVPCELFPVRRINSKLGFSGMFSWKLWLWAWRNTKNFDVIHLHLARDLITLPVGLIALVRGVPFVVQAHGMVDPTQRFLGRLLDVLATRRLLRHARRILYLTQNEENALKEVSGNKHSKMTFLPNGVPACEAENFEATKYVSFISRLQERKHPERFVQMAAILGSENKEFEFRIAGADEGRLRETLDLIQESALGSRIAYLGALEHGAVLELLSETKILVLPSVDEPFPMIILEAMSKSVPVVITESCGLAPYISKYGAGIVSNGSPDQLAQSVRTILENHEVYSGRAHKLSQDAFSMNRILEQLREIYDFAIEN